MDEDFISTGLRLMGCPPISEQAARLAYPELPLEDQQYPQDSLEANQMAALRRHNVTMPCRTNQRIYGTVMAVDKDRVYVDAGNGEPHRFNKQVCPLCLLVSCAAMVLTLSSSAALHGS